MATGLLRPDSGTVSVHGVDVWTHLVETKRPIGVLNDGVRLFDRLTGLQLVTYAGLLSGMGRAVVAERAADLLEPFDLEAASGTLVVDYSAGMALDTAALHAVIGVCTLAGSTLVWRFALDRALERPATSTSVGSAQRGLGWFRVFPGTPTGAVGPVVAVLLGMSIYTDVSYDNTAFSLHLQTAVSGRADRWDRLVGLLGVSLGLLLTGFALSSLVSGRFAFSVPTPGDNPLKSRPERASS